jgi:hypothetical protein
MEEGRFSPTLPKTTIPNSNGSLCLSLKDSNQGLSDKTGDFIINIPDQHRNCLTVPQNLGPLNIRTNASFEFINEQIQKIHKEFKPFLWLHQDPHNDFVFTITCLHMSYKISIYVDLESDSYVVEVLNVNMLGDVVSRIFEELKKKL